jgi:hypothetical protein
MTARDEEAKIEQSLHREAVVLEALLVLIHEKKSNAFLVEVTRLVNAILLGRHETSELSPKTVGGIMRRKLGLRAERRSLGYELLLTQDM